jgi:uncharacterized membrane protein YraQ (UPF0718 family)
MRAVLHLGLSFLALLLGPLLVYLARRHRGSTVSLDAFCLVTISGFALLHLLPECAEQAGWLVLPLALVGFVLPTLAERTLQHGHPGMRRLVLLLALLGMAAHDTLDGLFLADGSHLHHDEHGHSHSHEVTAWAVILHRIPEGVGIWWIVPRTLGLWPAILVSLATIGGTVFGFFLGDGLLGATSQRGLAMLQALLAGSLLHVVLHAHVPAPREGGRWHFASVAGAALAALVLWFVIHDHFPSAHGRGPAQVFLQLAMESAPALLLAYLLVGLCHAFLPAGWLQGMTRGSAFTQALRGVAIGLPLPVCSCGVVPIYRELIRQGTALAAALAFLVATPELELAAVTLTWRLMGPEVALVRVGMAAVLALAVGMLVGALADSRSAAEATPAGAMPAGESGSVGTRLKAALQFGFGPAVDNTATWILTGLLLSALLMPYVDRDWIAALPPGIDVPIAALIGLPLYVCATGSTPLAAMLLVQGLSPGAVLALLLTGPATNVTTFGMLARLHGGRVAFAFALAMWLGAVGLGYLANWLLPAPAIPALAAGNHEHDAAGWLWLMLLGLLFLGSLLRQGVRPFLERLFESPANQGEHRHDHSAASGHSHDHAGCCGTPPATTTPAAVFVPKTNAPLAPLGRSEPSDDDDHGGCCGHRH